MVCPYCSQGAVVPMLIKSIKQTIYICDECDTVWKNQNEISDCNGICFSLYAQIQGIEALWSELEENELEIL